uniref:ORF15 n=1 Tax=Nitrosopumilaceae spindle-shaped virus TaxID=3065433 RepID=A0AAT9J954_9VIRU
MTSKLSCNQELLAKLIIMKEFCDYMTIVNFLKGSEYCKVFYDVYFECSRILRRYGVIN